MNARPPAGPTRRNLAAVAIVIAVAAAAMGRVLLDGPARPRPEAAGKSHPAMAADAAARPHPATMRLLTAPPASAGRPRPATCPALRPSAGPAKYPPAALVAACRRRAEAVPALGAAAGVKLNVIVRAPFVVAGDLPPRRLESCAASSVLRPAGAMWASYFREKPTRPITILLLAGEAGYKRLARRDYPAGGEPHFGYYVSADARMVMNIATGTGTLVHELTHALIEYDFPDVPSWFNEGLASLHEQCVVRPDVIIGLVNWRLPALKAAIRAGTLRPLAELLSRRDFYGRRQGMNYAQARYFVMYMQKRGVLRDFYKYFRAHHRGEGADVRAVEHVFGRKIERIEKDFLAWLKTLPDAT
ncbi:MAG: hypothetical protein J7M21_03100 [Planctomycetes bacterium]|nr:hypothetical protein [Planctomycetota bacterium]